MEELGGRHTYKSANGSVIGYAVPLEGRTEYRAGNNATIGSADTNTLPFRPIPLENYLKQQKEAPAANGVCLTRITKLTPGGQASGAGLQLGDFLITFAGKDWTIFDLLNAPYEMMRPKVIEKVKATLEDDHLVMIVYRPAPSERDHAGGAIVALAPMNPGMKGYTLLTANITRSPDRKSMPPRSRPSTNAGLNRERPRRNSPPVLWRSRPKTAAQPGKAPL